MSSARSTPALGAPPAVGSQPPPQHPTSSGSISASASVPPLPATPSGVAPRAGVPTPASSLPAAPSGAASSRAGVPTPATQVLPRERISTSTRQDADSANIPERHTDSAARSKRRVEGGAVEHHDAPPARYSPKFDAALSGKEFVISVKKTAADRLRALSDRNLAQQISDAAASDTAPDAAPSAPLRRVRVEPYIVAAVYGFEKGARIPADVLAGCANTQFFAPSDKYFGSENPSLAIAWCEFGVVFESADALVESVPPFKKKILVAASFVCIVKCHRCSWILVGKRGALGEKLGSIASRTSILDARVSVGGALVGKKVESIHLHAPPRGADPPPPCPQLLLVETACHR